MIITSPAYHGLIQTQWEARDTSNDPKLTNIDWNLKTSAKLGQLAMSINDSQPDHTLLSDIVMLADILRSWYWTRSKSDFIEKLSLEKEVQISKWGEQHHSRMRWFLITAEEAGEIAEAIETEKNTDELIMEIVQLSAVLSTWVTSHDWFNPPETPHITECKNCGTIFETAESEIIKCKNCQLSHDCFGNISTKKVANPNANYPHKLRVAQQHRWLKRAEIQGDLHKQAELQKSMEALGIVFDENHPEYRRANP